MILQLRIKVKIEQAGAQSKVQVWSCMQVWEAVFEVLQKHISKIVQLHDVEKVIPAVSHPCFKLRLVIPADDLMGANLSHVLLKTGESAAPEPISPQGEPAAPTPNCDESF